MEIVLIAALGANRVIGNRGDLPWRLPDDMARFKRLTTGKPIVMGRKTYDTMGKPLPNRTNIVMSRSSAPIPGCTVVRTTQEAISAAAGAPELWVIGGGEIYAAFLPLAHRLELTEVDASPEGDALFPEFDRRTFHLAKEEPHAADAKHAHAFRYATYEKR
jgi:dihydrofolate reductase